MARGQYCNLPMRDRRNVSEVPLSDKRAIVGDCGPPRELSLDRKRPFGPTACQAASFWFECSAAHTQGMSWSSSEAGQRLMSRVSTSAK